ncbi:MAG: glycosyl hydrolase [Rubricoccaceae bacterium]
MRVAVLETRNYIVGEANAPSGLYIEEEGGWRHAGWTNLRCTALAQTPDALFLGAGNGVLRSRDGGASWRMTTDWRVTEVLDLVASPTDPNELVAATAYGLVRSRDAGDTWEPVPPPGRQPDATFTSAIVLDAEQTGRMLIATAAGLFVSDDDALSWRAIGPRLDTRALVQSAADPSRWLAGTAGHGALLSSDGGETWEPVGDASATFYAVAFDPHDPDSLAVGGYQMGVCLSRDGGSSWRTASPAHDAVSVYTLAFDPRQPGRLWIGTMGGGLFVDDGDGWQDAGLPETTVTDIRFP